MSDIVERLRAAAQGTWRRRELLDEAAAEVERLRGDLAEAEKRWMICTNKLLTGDQPLFRALDEADTKIERLRMHLDIVLAANDEFRAAMPKDWEGDPLNDACIRARAALAQEPRK